jgi:hypothetical protein
MGKSDNAQITVVAPRNKHFVDLVVGEANRVASTQRARQLRSTHPHLPLVGPHQPSKPSNPEDVPVLLHVHPRLVEGTMGDILFRVELRRHAERDAIHRKRAGISLTASIARIASLGVEAPRRVTLAQGKRTVSRLGDAASRAEAKVGG